MSFRKNKKPAQDDQAKRHIIDVESKTEFLEILGTIDYPIDIYIPETLILKNGTQRSPGNIQFWLYYSHEEHRLLRKASGESSIFDFFASYLSGSVKIAQFKQNLFQLGEFFRNDPEVRTLYKFGAKYAVELKVEGGETFLCTLNRAIERIMMNGTVVYLY
jgi:hypothetical protein